MGAVYPGVDLRYYGHAGSLEYDFIVAPKQNADVIRFNFSDVDTRLENDGNLTVAMKGSEPVRFEKPVAYQMLEGKRVAVDAHFQLAKSGEVSFALGNYDHSRELVIDPTLVYLGTLGTGIQQVSLSQMTVDAAGEIFLIGTTNDASFPVTAPTIGATGQQITLKATVAGLYQTTPVATGTVTFTATSTTTDPGNGFAG